jgi:hypothetical protein
MNGDRDAAEQKRDEQRPERQQDVQPGSASVLLSEQEKPRVDRDWKRHQDDPELQLGHGCTPLREPGSIKGELGLKVHHRAGALSLGGRVVRLRLAHRPARLCFPHADRQSFPGRGALRDETDHGSSVTWRVTPLVGGTLTHGSRGRAAGVRVA